MKTVLKIVLVMSILVQESVVNAQDKSLLEVSQYPAIPDKNGFAGMYAAPVEGEVLVAGGANFPDKMPWEGGVKKWYSTIYSLKNGAAKWELQELKLPQPMAYGVTAQMGNSMLIFGGNTTDNIPSPSVLKIERKNNALTYFSLREMPVALANMCGARLGNCMYIATGSKEQDGTPSNVFFAYDITKDEWVNLPDVPGPARINAVCAVYGGKFYLFSGIQIDKVGEATVRKILNDAYCFEPEYIEGSLVGGSWHRLSNSPIGLAAGPVHAPVNKKGEVVFLGGLDQQTAQHADPKSHPGFLNDVYAYHIATDTWRKVGILPKKEMRLTLPGIQQGDCYLLINGEVGPGVRTNTILAVNIEKL